MNITVETIIFMVVYLSLFGFISISAYFLGAKSAVEEIQRDLEYKYHMHCMRNIEDE